MYTTVRYVKSHYELGCIFDIGPTASTLSFNLSPIRQSIIVNLLLFLYVFTDAKFFGSCFITQSDLSMRNCCPYSSVVIASMFDNSIYTVCICVLSPKIGYVNSGLDRFQSHRAVLGPANLNLTKGLNTKQRWIIRMKI